MLNAVGSALCEPPEFDPVRWTHVSVLLPIVWAAIPMLSQDDFPPDTLAPPTPSSIFLGTWEARLQGRQSITIKLIETRGKIVGVMSESHFLLDHDGNVVKVTAPPTEYRVTNGKVDRSTFVFTAESRDSGTVENFEMRLSDDVNAAVRRIAPATPEPSRTWKVRKISPD